tara:strand:- start:23377 stop:24108 length:732 start_codon:yes stop_codon:yes gene_type:complete
MNIVAIVQARCGSTRLPNKVFLKILKKPIIWHVFNRLNNSKKITKLVLATTDSKSDDDLEKWAIKNRIDYYRGSEDNVLNRFYNASKKYNADIIVRITADDPLKDVNIIDQVIDMTINNGLDFGFNNFPPTFPEGMDVEVFTFDALQIAEENSTDSFEREHVTQYFHRNSSLFNSQNYKSSKDYSKFRLTIDTELDLKMIDSIFTFFEKSTKKMNYKNILDLLLSKPEISMINSEVKRSEMYK